MALLRDRWSQGVAADALEVIPCARRHPHRRIEVEPTARRMTRPAYRRQRRLVRHSATAPDRGAGPWPQCCAALYGGRRQPRQQRLFVHPRIGDVRFGLLVQHAPPAEHPVDAPRQRADERLQVALPW